MTVKDIMFTITLGVMALFVFDGCEAKRNLEKQSISLANYTDSVSIYKSKSGNLVSINEALIVSNESQVRGLEEKLEDLKLKKAKVAIEYKTEIEIKEVEVPIDIPCKDFILPIIVDSTYYNIKGLLTNKALKLNTISIPNEQFIAIANKREKWWKKSVYSVVVTNSNPYVTSLGLKSYTIEPEKEFYKKRWFWTAIGFAGGAYLTNQLK